MQLSKGLAFSVITVIACVQVAHAFRGDATWYNTGLGSCGVINNDNEFIAAVPSPETVGRRHCGRRIRIFHEGRSVEATVQDTCPGCNQFSVDLSPAAFKRLAPLEAGRIKVDWEYIL